MNLNWSLYILSGLIFICCNNQQPNGTVSESTNQQSNNVTKEKKLIIGERVDGPANFRDTVNGKLIFEIYDNVLLETAPEENDWLIGGVYLKVSEEVEKFGKLIPGSEIYNLDNEAIGLIHDSVSLIFWYEEEGFIWGYTHTGNVKQNSVPESELIKLINAGFRNISDYNSYMKNFQFGSYDAKFDLPNGYTEFFIYESVIVDQSPRDRISLLFKSDKLVGIVHSRKMVINNLNTYDLVRGHKLTVTSDISSEEVEELKRIRINFYNSVD